jgi:hypothetical protein
MISRYYRVILIDIKGSGIFLSNMKSIPIKDPVCLTILD